MPLTGDETKLVVLLIEAFPERRKARELADSWGGRDERFIQRLWSRLVEKLRRFDLLESGVGHGACSHGRFGRLVRCRRRSHAYGSYKPSRTTRPPWNAK